MKAQHTPGPWYSSSDGSEIFDQTEHAPVAFINGANQDSQFRTGPQVMANARLISAAPDLLEALQRSLNWLSSYPGGNANGVYEQARAAVAKAMGEA